MSHPHSKYVSQGITAALMLAVSVPRVAQGATTVTNHFAPNTTVKSAEVNQNFSDLASAIDGKASGIEYSGTGADCGSGICGQVTANVTSIGSITVSVPGPGTILLLLSGTLLIGDDEGVASLGIGESATQFSVETQVGRARVDNTNHLITFETFSLMHVVPVTAAGPRTFHALAQRNPSIGGSAPMSVGWTKLVALFVPTRL
jgi:hypothetical protein